MRKLRERSLTREERDELNDYSQKGLDLLGLSRATEPEVAIAAIDEFVNSWQKRRRGLLAKFGFRRGDSIETALSLGSVWGNHLARRFEWSWSCLVTEEDERYAAVSPDRSLVIYPMYFIRECLEFPTADCTVLLAFNLMVAGEVSGGEPYEYESVMPIIHRIIPRALAN